MLDPDVRLRLSVLFRDPRMFESRSRLQRAGFAVVGEGLKSDIMVASHPSLPGYLLKKYSDELSPRRQLENYRRRIEGAERLRAFITAQRLTHIVVPRKFLYDLPAAFSREGVASPALIVDRLPILDRTASKQQFGSLSNEVLRQLCLVIVAFRGLDSGARNVAFTRGGQLAFVDTERWSESKTSWLHHIRKYLSSEQRKIADAFFESRR